MFGTNSSNFNFGPTNPSFQTNTFQSNVGLQQMATSAQPASTEQLVTRFQTFPYGDSPQLQIDVTIPPNTKVRTKFTTDPKTLNQYKISAKTVENRPQRIFNNSGKINTMLFDGLEEENSEENKTAKDIFVPRKNIKKLVFKPKNTSISNLNESQSPSSSFLKTQQQRESIKFNDSIASEMTVNEFMPNNNNSGFSKQNQSITKERLTISPSEKDDSSPLFSRLNSTEMGREQNETVLSIIIPKCGVIQTRTDYFTIPTIEELDSAYDMSSETCIVDSFTVGRHDYGSIYWDGPIDVKGINLDEIVHIRRKEVIVYPDDDVKPRIGEGLNRAAQITLHQVWPIDKTTHEIIKDIERLRSMKYAEKIETATHKLGATFKEYRPDTGSWVFTVKHFSKYGLTEEDDDEEEDELLDQSSNEAINQPIPKQIVSTKEFSANKKNLSTKESEPLALNASSDELSAKILKPKDNTMNFLFDDKDSEELDDIEADKSLDYSSQFQTEFSEYDKMRSTLFDDYEDIAVVTKKSKNYSFLVSQNEIKSKKQFQSSYFPPVISAVKKPVKLERRSLTFEPDIHSAKNKIVCDISSVCVSQSPKISFFNGSRKFTFIKGGTVLICELNLINFDNSTVDRFEEQLKNNSKIIVTPSMNQIIPPFIETREFSKNSYNPLELELLVEALYGNLSQSTPYAYHQERIDRIKVWLFSVNKKLSLPKKTTSKIIHFLSTNELEAAVDEAINTSHPRLASLLSFGNTINKYLLIAQLDSWKCCKADLFIEKELLKIYILLSGQINWRISSGVEINILEGLNWTQQLALILLYITPSEGENNELGVELLKTSISHLTVLPDEVEYHLLAGHTPWVAMSSSSNILESWFLHQSLKSYRVIIDENGLSAGSDAVHCLLASQITDICWSCFVASHIKHDIIREMVIKEILGRNSLKLEQNEGIEKWLLNNISLTNDYMAEAKAIKSKASFNHKNLALNLIECGHWTEAHEVLVEYVFPEMIINEENDSIKELISKLKPHSSLISNWFSNGAHIYETYINCLQSSNIEDIKSFNIHQLRCNTKRHVLCQSEMARKANILYSELSGGIHPYNTPIPDDYALLELKMNAKKLVKILC
jgi:nuclear pore complex protein Nup98-Nup96